MRALVALLLLCVLSSDVLAQATITLVVKTGYPTSIKLSEKLGVNRPRVVWRESVGSGTTLNIRIDPATVGAYLLQDANALTTIWIKAESGDSLVYQLDLDSGTYEFVYDKQGYSKRSGRIGQVYARYQSRVDSALSVLPYSAFHRNAKVLQSEYAEAIKPMLDSMESSKRYPELKARTDFFATAAILKFLGTPWSEATKTTMCGKMLSYTTLVGYSISNDAVFTEAVSSWFNVIGNQIVSCGGSMAAIDSLARDFVGTFKGRKRGLAYLAYTAARLQQETDLQVARSLLAAMPEYITDQDLAAQYSAMIDERLALEEGRVAPEIELPDSNGVLRKLSTIRGKFVLLDFWGTWCGPCIRELPHVEALAKAYSPDDLQIVGIALEHKKVRGWINFIRERAMPGIQLYAESQSNNEELQSYNISSVPRYVLLDREGRIVTAYAPRPSNPKLRELLDQLIGKH